MGNIFELLLLILLSSKGTERLVRSLFHNPGPEDLTTQEREVYKSLPVPKLVDTRGLKAEDIVGIGAGLPVEFRQVLQDEINKNIEIQKFIDQLV